MQGIERKLIQTWRVIKYIDYEGLEITSSPFLTFEDEQNTGEKVITNKKRKTVLDSESDCGDVKIKYGYYETNVYYVNGKQIDEKKVIREVDGNKIKNI